MAHPFGTCTAIISTSAAHTVTESSQTYCLNEDLKCNTEAVQHCVSFTLGLLHLFELPI